MDFKTRIQQRIAEMKTDTFTERQLFVRFNISAASEKREVKSALDELVADGEYIVNESGKYMTPAAFGAVKGTLIGNRRGFAFCTPDGGGSDIFIPPNALGGALHKDKVYIRVKKGKEKGKTEGEVVSILERGVKSAVGTFKRAEGYGFVVADDDCFFRDILIPAQKFRGALDGYKVVARITGYREGKRPEGEITEILGKGGEALTEVLAITRSFGFSDAFEKTVKKEAALAAERPFSAENRKDFRGLLTVTIDGDDAKDLDDAVSVAKCGEDYKLYVHIADVNHYVRHKSILDNEAFKRATSVYFPGNVLPMLPEELSNGVCSLNEKTDRLTLSVEMLIDRAGNVKGHRLYESVIHSNARMTYKNVNKILDGDNTLTERYAEIVPMLRNMYDLSRILYGRRKSRGSVFFETKESVIEVDKKGKVLDIKPYEYGVSNSIIEEFMLIANETVAEFIGHLELPFVYRVHETPSSEKMEFFKQFMLGIGIKIRADGGVKPPDIQKFLELVENTEYKNIVNKILLRSMQKARYDVVNRGHFGLAAKSYCHFTSPIRRYPDLVVHRIIKMMLNGELNDKTVKRMAAFCQEAAANSSEREKAAESAERQCDDYYKASYMEDKTGTEYDGVVSSVTAFGIFVELPNTVEGLVRTEWLPRDDYAFDEQRFLIKGRKHSYSLGDKVKIRVESADRNARQVNFSLVE